LGWEAVGSLEMLLGMLDFVLFHEYTEAKKSSFIDEWIFE